MKIFKFLLISLGVTLLHISSLFADEAKMAKGLEIFNETAGTIEVDLSRPVSQAWQDNLPKNNIKTRVDISDTGSIQYHKDKRVAKRVATGIPVRAIQPQTPGSPEEQQQ